MKTDLKEMGCEDVNWMPHERFQWRAVVNPVMNPRVSLNRTNFLTRRASESF